MSSTLPTGVRSAFVKSNRLNTHILTSGPEDGEAVVLVHGNVSSSRFFAELMATLPAQYRVIAPDLRGFGKSEPAPVDATRGVQDFADDVLAMLDTLGVDRAHFVGWSVGAAVIQQIAIDPPDRVRSLTLESPMAPFGFGGTRDVSGTACHDDWAGTGGGTANPDFVQRLGAGDRTSEADTSPRSIMNGFYFKPPFQVDDDTENAYVDAMLDTVTGDANYPGDLGTSPNWPGIAPGTGGMNNAISGKYCDVSAFADVSPKPPVLWIRGADDQIVSDTSLFCLGFLGQLGAVPGWPGADVFPPQPMIGQIRAVLDRYAAGGGSVKEVVLPECGHSPHIEEAARFQELLVAHLGGGAA